MNIDIKKLRLSTGLSQTKFAHIVGVSVSTLRRWETGSTRPSRLANDRLLQVAKMSPKQMLKESSGCMISGKFDESMELSTEFKFCGREYSAEYMPYVINGPKDQFEFHSKLISMQQRNENRIPRELFFRRLSMLKSVDGILTTQFRMESPKNTAKCWSSDYGTHGFHRYVGRFPSHLVRALINAFGLVGDDVILDPFCGSGTTLVEARMLGVKALGIEISPLSAMISRVKSSFPDEGITVSDTIRELTDFYHEKWSVFVSNRSIEEIDHHEILSRPGNRIKAFANIDKWFSKNALLGTSIVLEFLLQKTDYLRDFITIALSAKMRSIGNVDVDVVRAEYRKEPRNGVDVLKLVTNQLRKMERDIHKTIEESKDIIGSSEDIEIIQGSLLDAKISQESISCIITSPPYGVESLSYLRTHLLSFRSLEAILGVDPYNFRDGVIGSEYLDDVIPDIDSFLVRKASKTYMEFFHSILEQDYSTQEKKRVTMMMKFFEDMYHVVHRFAFWLKQNGKVAFIIGNKKIGKTIIPTDTIINEIFEFWGFRSVETIAHKLKTNNSNSQVPWQERIIQDEFVMIFEKGE